MVFVPPLALWLRLSPPRQLDPLSVFSFPRHLCTQAMPPRGRRHRARIPECLERPQYERHCIGGVNYRLLRLPGDAAALNRAEWNPDDFEAYVEGGGERGLSAAEAAEREQQQQRQQQKQRDRKDIDASDLSVSSFSSESENTDAHDSSCEAMNTKEDVSLTAEEIQQQEDALDAEYIAACGAAKEGESWSLDIPLPVSIFRRLTLKINYI
ncbi:uncharacterized protein EMH_0046250 [Eimeria mitis]|uniref:Uncharacterized protein n=1 Tax=Eimeria mitis TaxID=44415 RepID=U6JU87_9EIME|nr:uncharacterized protein EMH_0046250 [Eimeria mitis]CDJ29025.1 hypothetical protein EMH_0046250 [Eimeria mitis]